MPVVLLIVVTSIYLWVAIIFACQANWAMAIVYFGYALANVGLMAIP
jgi:hypothetical protein